MNYKEGGLSLIYFDNAATSRKKPEEVYEAFNYYVREIGTSPGRGSYSLGIQASRMLYQSRKTVADFFGIKEAENVVFTKNSTEAINLFFNGFLQRGDHVLISSYEHNAVLRPLHALFLNGIIEYTIINENDLYNDTDCLRKYIKNNTKLVVLTLASNLTGQLVFSSRIANFFNNKGIYVFVDASQGAGKKLINIEEDNIDFLAFTGHKDLLAFPGVGGLCSKEKMTIKPLIQGGTGINGDGFINPEAYPDAYEAGTINMPAIWALKQAIEYINANLSDIKIKEDIILNAIIEGLKPNAKLVIYNEHHKRVPTVCFNIQGIKSNEVIEYLDKNGVCVRGGIHCAILAHQSINTVKTGAIRVSINHFNSLDEVNEFLRVLSKMGD